VELYLQAIIIQQVTATLCASIPYVSGWNIGHVTAHTNILMIFLILSRQFRDSAFK
jgi:hypothetical protein